MTGDFDSVQVYTNYTRVYTVTSHLRYSLQIIGTHIENIQLKKNWKINKGKGVHMIM